MPLQRRPIRPPHRVRRRDDLLPVQLVVVPAVLELLADAAADFEAEVGGDGDVAGVEEAVDVAAQEEAVAGFVYVIRGSPMLVQAYILYFGLAQFEAVRESIFWPVLKSPWFCAAIAFAINSAAYQVEIYRGGLNAVPRGEIEATAAIGMSRTMALHRIILPSALRRCLPMMANESIFLLHGSAIASMLTVIDVLGAARRFNAQYYLAYEGFLAATVIYMVLVFGITRILGFVERKTLKHLALRSVTNRIQTQLI